MSDNIKRIFIDCSVFDGEYQGSFVYLTNLIRILQEYSNHQLFCGVNDSVKAQSVLKNDRNISYIEYKQRNRYLRYTYVIPLILSKGDFDFALFQYYKPPYKLSSVITLVVVHDILYLDFPELFNRNIPFTMKIMLRYSVKKSDKILTVSEYTQKRILDRFGTHLKNKIILTANGLGDEWREAIGTKEEHKSKVLCDLGLENYVLYVSRLENRKNHTLLLRYARENKDVNVVFVGSNTFSEKSLIRDFQRESNVHYFENVPPDTLRSLYAACEVFVYPSLAEGFGIPPLEAASCSVPVVCSNSTAMAQFKFFGETHFDPKSYESFIQAMRSAKSQDKEHIEQLRKHCLNTFTWEKSFESLISYLNE